jgi:hypothetical protein
MERRYRVTGYSGEEREAVIEIRTFDRGARVRRAAAGLATWWAVAIGCVFIPVAHFVLVPAFAVMGIVSVVRRLKTLSLVVAARGTCPDCGAEQQLDIDGPWRDDQPVSCRHCHRSLRLTAA